MRIKANWALLNAIDQHDISDFGVHRRVQQRRSVRRDVEPAPPWGWLSREVGDPAHPMRLEVQKAKHGRRGAFYKINPVSGKGPILVYRPFGAGQQCFVARCKVET